MDSTKVVPILAAKSLTHPERVSQYNIHKLQQLVQNGPGMWPGANCTIKKDSDFKPWLKYGDGRRGADALFEGYRRGASRGHGGCPI